MNADDVVKYGHQTVLAAIDGLPDAAWEVPGVCGSWSVKDVVAHLASYELAMVDILAGLVEGGPTPCLDELLAQGPAFNDLQVERRRDQGAAETVEEYSAASERAAALLARVPVGKRREAGFLPWYGAEYDLEDVIAYMSYGHKREHSAQIAVFRDRPTS